MGEWKWLTELGPTGLLALTVVFILVGQLAPRWVLKREQQISAQWQAIAMEAMANQQRQTILLQQIITELQKPAEYRLWGDTVDRPRHGRVQ